MSKNINDEKISVLDGMEPRVNRYYLRISRKYMAAGIVLMLTLIVYIIAVMLFLGQYVTYDNLKFLVRDISALSLTGDSEYSSIVYNGGDELVAHSFRGGTAICTVDSYLYYDSSGSLLVEDSCSYSSPAIRTSEKYLLLYDVGGDGYSVYNQLTGIIERTSSQNIVTGDIADDGSLILATRSRETKYVVELYNSAFNKSMSIYKENYIFAAAISPNGEYIIIASGVPSDTDIGCEISIIKKGSDTPLYTTSYTHTMPLEIETVSDGFMLLCDNGYYYYDYSGGLISSYSFSGMNLRYADMTASGVVVVGSVNALGSENRCVVFDQNGQTVYTEVIEKRITGAYSSINYDDAYAYITSSSGVIKIKPDGEQEEYVPDDEILTVVPLSSGALLCSENSAVKVLG